MKRSFKDALTTHNAREVEEHLIDGADVNASYNPLCLAIRYRLFNSYEIPTPLRVIELLLDYNADINAPRWVHVNHILAERTPLMTASSGGAVDIVNLLVARGVDVLQCNGDNKTALDVVYELYLQYVGNQEGRLQKGRRQVITILINEMDRVNNETHTQRNLALFMGQHPRLGKQSRLTYLEPEVLTMVAQYTHPRSSRETDYAI
jgi:hypothetical protein